MAFRALAPRTYSSGFDRTELLQSDERAGVSQEPGESVQVKHKEVLFDGRNVA